MGFTGNLMGFTLWKTKSLQLKMAIEIVDLPSYKMVDLSIFFVCLPDMWYHPLFQAYSFNHHKWQMGMDQPPVPLLFTSK